MQGLLTSLVAAWKQKKEALTREDLDVKDFSVQMGEQLSRSLSDCIRFHPTLFLFRVSLVTTLL